MIPASTDNVQAIVNLVNDDIFENTEQFSALISLAVADSAVRIITPMATVDILDDDRKWKSSIITSQNKLYLMNHFI